MPDSLRAARALFHSLLDEKQRRLCAGLQISQAGAWRGREGGRVSDRSARTRWPRDGSNCWPKTSCEKLKRIVKFTVETERTLIFRSRGGRQVAWCKRCGAEVERATVDETARAAGVSELTICRRADAGSFRFIVDKLGQVGVSPWGKLGGKGVSQLDSKEKPMRNVMPSGGSAASEILQRENDPFLVRKSIQPLLNP